MRPVWTLPPKLAAMLWQMIRQHMQYTVKSRFITVIAISS